MPLRMFFFVYDINNGKVLHLYKGRRQLELHLHARDLAWTVIDH